MKPSVVLLRCGRPPPDLRDPSSPAELCHRPVIQRPCRPRCDSEWQGRPAPHGAPATLDDLVLMVVRSDQTPAGLPASAPRDLVHPRRTAELLQLMLFAHWWAPADGEAPHVLAVAALGMLPGGLQGWPRCPCQQADPPAPCTAVHQEPVAAPPSCRPRTSSAWAPARRHRIGPCDHTCWESAARRGRHTPSPQALTASAQKQG
mmetsp:Transcript_3897/g.11303  ORF Transcript_3897/g.11303 Transcript_3897/m.11303 type:complete len:204 (+) Transcript_3897:545-1156(+)